MGTTLKEGLPLKLVKKQGDAVSAAVVCGYKYVGPAGGTPNFQFKKIKSSGCHVCIIFTLGVRSLAVARRSRHSETE